jgi:DNA-binding transcriptional MerR regulator
LSKGPNAFRTISEAAEELGVPQHVLRFWETKFSFIRPMKRAGGRRFYRPQDVAVLQGVKTLLYSQGYKIEGVQRLHRQEGIRRLIAAADPAAAEQFDEAEYAENGAGAPENGAGERAPEAAPGDVRERLERVLRQLQTAKARLDTLLDRARA